MGIGSVIADLWFVYIDVLLKLVKHTGSFVVNKVVDEPASEHRSHYTGVRPCRH